MVLALMCFGAAPAALADWCWDPDSGGWVWHEPDLDFPDYESHWQEHKSEFPRYTNAYEYKDGAREIARRTGDTVRRCVGDNSREIIREMIESSIVIVQYSQITTYFKPADVQEFMDLNCRWP